MNIIIRAKLNDQKRVYRDIIVNPQMNLYDLAGVVLDSFGFMRDHCFGFYSAPGVYGKGKDAVHYELFYDTGDEVEELCKSVEQTPVKELFTQPKDKWWMLFDYGEDWLFELVYQQDAPALFADRPVGTVITTKGDSPEQYPEWDSDE